MSTTHVQDAVREKYGEIARSVGKSGCCGPTSCGCGDPITSNLYSDDETAGVPADAVAVSLGCGNPTALIDLQPGQTVLDLGSGGGIDVLLSAKRVGPAGKVYGLDMTDDMLTLARENQRKAGATNVEFLKGTIEAIPLPDQSVDVIISNCVINLSADKDAVLREAFRVSNPVADSPSRTSSFAGRCQRRFAAAWSCGLDAWRARFEMTSTRQSCRRQGSLTSSSNRGGYIKSTMRVRSSPTPASTSTGSRPRLTARWRARSSAHESRRAKRAAARPVARELSHFSTSASA